METVTPTTLETPVDRLQRFLFHKIPICLLASFLALVARQLFLSSIILSVSFSLSFCLSIFCSFVYLCIHQLISSFTCADLLIFIHLFILGRSVLPDVNRNEVSWKLDGE